MSDEIKGVAVLDDRGPDHFLFCVCVPDPAIHPQYKGPFIQRLPVRPKDSMRTKEPQWEYLVDGLIVRMCPSVRVSTTRPEGEKNIEFELFHNPRDWWVHFVRWSDISAGRAEDNRWLACHELNAALLAQP